MSVSSELDKTVKQYILECITSEGYSEVPYFNDCTSIEKKIGFLRAVFYAEYGYEVGKVGEQQAMQQWIAGLPSSFNIEYRNHEILKLAIKWGSLNEHDNEAAYNKITENWFNFIAVKTVQLFNGYRVPKSS